MVYRSYLQNHCAYKQQAADLVPLGAISASKPLHQLQSACRMYLISSNSSCQHDCQDSSCKQNPLELKPRDSADKMLTSRLSPPLFSPLQMCNFGGDYLFEGVPQFPSVPLPDLLIIAACHQHMLFMWAACYTTDSSAVRSPANVFFPVMIIQDSTL